jgi:hypothetical protein
MRDINVTYNALYELKGEEVSGPTPAMRRK